MSLLDDVSIVVTPNGYKAGELYAVVPVPTLGSEEVLNGEFATDSNWEKSSFWTISGDTASMPSTSSYQPLYQNNVTIAEKTYVLNFEIISITGIIKASSINNGAASGEITLGEYSTIGNKKITFITQSGGEAIAFARVVGNTSSCTISNVSVKEYTSADMDVTRETAATRVDENGLVNYAEVVSDTDIVTNGDFSNGSTDWTLQNGWALGSNDVVFTPSASSYRKLFQVNFLTIGKVYKLSFEIKSISAGSIANFEPNSPSFNTVGVKTQTYVATFDDLYLEPTNDANLTIDNISVKEVTRDNVPRIDYTGGGCPHILAEPQRTNVNTDSQDFSKSFYIKDSGVSVGDTNFVSPSGESNATQIEVNNNGRIYANVASDTYASSWYIKAGTFSYFRSGGDIDLVAGTFSGGTIESVGNGWFRISKQYTGNRPFQIQAYPDGTYSSHTTYGNYYIWGSQIEAGSYATSYIPTIGSTVTRNQDIFTRDGIGSLINSTEGVLFAEIASLSESGNYRELGLSDGTTSNRVLISYKSTDNVIRGSFQGSGGANLEYTLTSSKDFHKIAVKWKVNDFALWVDGVEVGSDTSGSSFPADTLNSLSLDDGGGASKFFGKVKQLQVFKTALTDEQLLQLTGESGTDFYESYAEMASALTYTIQ